MINALKEKDQRVALAASEFWSGLVSVKSKTNEDMKMSMIRNILPSLLPCLLDCSRFTDNDRMQLMPSKEADIGVTEKSSIREGDEEKDYEVEENENFTTLRKSSAFTIERFSKFY